MNVKKIFTIVLLIGLFWLLYIIGKGANEHFAYVVMTGVGLIFVHISILEFVDMIFDCKSKKFPEVNLDNLKVVLVWSDENRKSTSDTMKAIVNKLSKEHGVNAYGFYGNDDMEFYTDKVKVKFITKVDEYRGLKYDKAFGFNNKPYARPLIKYILEQHDI